MVRGTGSFPRRRVGRSTAMRGSCPRGPAAASRVRLDGGPVADPPTRSTGCTRVSGGGRSGSDPRRPTGRLRRPPARPASTSGDGPVVPTLHPRVSYPLNAPGEASAHSHLDGTLSVLHFCRHPGPCRLVGVGVGSGVGRDPGVATPCPTRPQDRSVLSGPVRPRPLLRPVCVLLRPHSPGTRPDPDPNPSRG